MFDLDIDICTVYWFYENKSNQILNKKVIHKVYQHFFHPYYNQKSSNKQQLSPKCHFVFQKHQVHSTIH